MLYESKYVVMFWSKLSMLIDIILKLVAVNVGNFEFLNKMEVALLNQILPW